MPRQTFVGKLSMGHREELNRALRARGYGGSIELAKWLEELGYESSKSSVHRYAQALRASDGLSQATGYEIDARQAVAPNGLSRRQQLLLELGALREREYQLLNDLLDLSELEFDPETGDAPGEHSSV
ncbi:MAG: DUF3486 family protein [Nitrococcus mobilis]|nr:DUF3486 family protein [Nitrococcus mobilis]